MGQEIAPPWKTTQMTKQEIQSELDKSLARIDGSLDEIKSEITKPFDELIQFVEEKPLIAIGSALLIGVTLSAILSKSSGSGISSLDRKSAETLIEAGIANRDAGMSVGESIDSAIRQTPVSTVNYQNNARLKSGGFLTGVLGSKVGKQVAQTLFKNGLNLLNSFVQDRVRKS